MLKTFISFFFCAVLFSCTESPNNKMIQGNWKATEWLVNGQPSEVNARQTSFSFDDKGNYSFAHGGANETGSYKVENNMLFTTPKGETEMMVKIIKLTQDSLVFDMNRGGQPETLTLLRN
jgi:heat shock protein HslJ